MSIRVMVALGLALLLQACQPAYTVDQTKTYARNMGLLNQYTIERMSNNSLYYDSRIVVSANDMGPAIDTQAVINLAVTGMQSSFSSVSPLKGSMSLEQAKKKAKVQHNSDFLFHLALVNADKSAKKQGENEEEQKKKDNYNEITLIITVIDVYRGKVFDKILLQASDNIFPLNNTDADDLLSKPFAELGKIVTGAK